jgi:cycloeucalenol cycloisomerase
MNASLLDPDFGSSILNNQKEMLGLIDTNDVAVSMTVILGTMVSLLVGLTYLQTTSKDAATMSRFLPCADSEPSKYAYELYALYYSPLWIGAFSVIVIFELYEDFSAVHYNSVLLALALPLLLQPIVFPSAGFDSPDQNRPLWERYSFKANVWLAIYSFIGNYWYTHYFYSVLKAEYSMPATRLNNVPIAMFFATHFYFSTCKFNSMFIEH